MAENCDFRGEKTNDGSLLNEVMIVAEMNI